ncbi:hypothetical protein D3C81_1939180 [compost metagenome]
MTTMHERRFSSTTATNRVHALRNDLPRVRAGYARSHRRTTDTAEETMGPTASTGTRARVRDHPDARADARIVRHGVRR